MILINGIKVRRDSPLSMKMRSSKIEIKKIDGSDINFCKMSIGGYLYQKSLHKSLSGMEPDSMTT